MHVSLMRVVPPRQQQVREVNPSPSPSHEHVMGLHPLQRLLGLSFTAAYTSQQLLFPFEGGKSVPHSRCTVVTGETNSEAQMKLMHVLLMARTSQPISSFTTDPRARELVAVSWTCFGVCFWLLWLDLAVWEAEIFELSPVFRKGWQLLARFSSSSVQAQTPCERYLPIKFWCWFDMSSSMSLNGHANLFRISMFAVAA